MQRSGSCASRLAAFWTEDRVRHERNGRNTIACRLLARGIYRRGAETEHPGCCLTRSMTRDACMYGRDLTPTSSTVILSYHDCLRESYPFNGHNSATCCSVLL